MKTSKTHQPAIAERAKEPLQVRIPREVKRRFKAAAAMRGMDPNELFVEVWSEYAARHKILISE